MDDDDGFSAGPAPRPFSELSIESLLTTVQRLHIERMLEALTDGVPSPQVMAQINRMLADNGIVAPPMDGPLIEGRKHDRPALPDYGSKRFDE